ncbi:uncharacterized protein LOC142236632 [Haematobia irritans]|uniref:uncharacterized protein LOC142236632 n=1 Tax=Haematobia irritans TaxID=7368 RepID=UPI003F4F66DB
MFGVKKSILKFGLRYQFFSNEEFCGAYFQTENLSFMVLPLYIRSADWRQEFERAKVFFEEKKCENIILIGDINVRIGDLQQDIVELYLNYFRAYTGMRKSLDNEVNLNGRKYIDFCNEQNLIILNGQTKGDDQGNLTYVSNVGTSVNDICAVDINILQYVEDFHVEEKIWSDHLPISLSLLLYNTALAFYYINDFLEHKNITCLKEMTDIITASVVQRNSIQHFEPKQKWFNSSCYWARKTTFECLSKFRKTHQDSDKVKYLNAKKKYKDICETSKRIFYAEIVEKLKYISNGKEWWSLVRLINDQNFQISSSLSAEALKDHFFTLLQSQESNRSIEYAPNLMENHILDSDITVDEIKHMLRKTKPNKAPGEDRIPYEFFVNATDEFLTKLAEIYNNIYSNSKMDEVFQKSIIFPIHKKGSLDDAANYRGISFMNSAAKIFMGILNERLLQWTEENGIMDEHQAGFRKNYSAMDNIYNLAAIVNIKLEERKKIYAFFVDFRAAFDKIPRNLLIFKLHQMGISLKYVKMIEAVYSNTQSAVWTGKELSSYFETQSGVKQGCLLSPLLFSLYINDLSESLGEGLYIEDINIRVLLYADDIVLLAEEPSVLVTMINKLEEYCNKWNLVVNTSKSKIMIFRKGGRVSQNNTWIYQGERLEIVPDYKYLGVILTPQMKFSKHIQARNNQAKSAIKCTWNNFLRKDDISLEQKWNLYTAACRSVQTYGAQIWGYGNFEQVDQLQRFFLKLVLRLPECTPNYALYIETGMEESHLYTLQLHLRYILRTIYQYTAERLPHQMTLIIIRKNLFWAKYINNLLNELGMPLLRESTTSESWNSTVDLLLENLCRVNREKSIQRAQQSTSRFYRNLDPDRGKLYFTGGYTLREITLIFKARVDLIYLNSHNRNADDQCSLCNLSERETLYHFLAVCPIFRGQRTQFFCKTYLSEQEVVQILDGRGDLDWRNLVKYIAASIIYRKLIMSEYS